MKVFFSRDLMGERKKNGKFKIDGIIVEHGYDCLNSCWCKHGAECKYRGRYRFHNACVAIQRFFQYRLGWKWFRIPFYFQTHSSDLSGTIRCPHHMPRRKDCWHCVYSCGDRNCRNKERAELIREGRFKELDCEERCRCKLFEPDEWFDKYDRKTGDTIFSEVTDSHV